VALMVVGEEELRVPNATESVLAEVPTVTAALALAELPAVLVAVAVMWCAPRLNGMEALIVGAELACCQARAESTKTRHLAMAYGELALAMTRAGEAGCTGCRLTEMLAEDADVEEGRNPPEPQPKAPIKSNSNNPVTAERTPNPPGTSKNGLNPAGSRRYGIGLNISY